MQPKIIFAIICLVVFAASSVIHLIRSWQDNPRRAYTKPLLLLSLLGFYLCAAPSVSWVLVAALLTSWLGDVLLMPKGNKWFVAGGISFLISHILFIFVYVPYITLSAVKWWVVIPVALVYFGIAAAVMRAVWGNTPKMMRVPMFLYLVANSTMNLFALMMLFSVRSLGGVLAYIGAVLFFTSDCTLFLVRYHDNKELIFKKHYTVMLTYIAGEALITLGILALQYAAL